MDTIFAVSSGAPPAAIAVLRVSGPAALAAATALAGRLPPPRRAGLRTLADPRDGTPLDRALVLVFPGPDSATGEDVVELHLHGGRAVVAAVEAALAAQPGLRPAAPGEFTRRALAAGRIDLAQAEGLGDLLTAETEAQRRAALSAAEGAVSRQVGGWNARLLELAARTEALLDFADEEDVADGAEDAARLAAEARSLADEIAGALDNPPVERLRDGIRVVLAGAPNAGKSTLLNALAEREAAIVSPIAGTTRDRIEAAVVRDGLAFVLTDTAGLAATTDDPIERIGIARAREAMAAADIVVLLDETPVPAGAIVIPIYPRCDEPERAGGADRLAVSARTGAGVAALWRAIAEAGRGLVPRLDRLVLNRRQRDAVAAAQAALIDASAEADPLLIAEYLRRARMALDRVTGASDTEAMLDALFGRFCIGK
ncbi:MAG TPA: tRNA uridine-5-carboxymethylaminomethyl(34) synthesis GTPase MnmE [Sphingomonas sp.]|nr:tRNA uridine-5-carboxymethylaminomethyl(34) synthesis GTPase MnmE [Sphingomonas sp.]